MDSFEHAKGIRPCTNKRLIIPILRPFLWRARALFILMGLSIAFIQFPASTSQYLSFDLNNHIGYLERKKAIFYFQCLQLENMKICMSWEVLLLCSSYMHHCESSFFVFSYAGPWGHCTRSIHTIQGRDCHAWSPPRVPFEGEAAKACYCKGLDWLWQTKRELRGGQRCRFINLINRPAGTQRQRSGEHILLSNIILFITWRMFFYPKWGWPVGQCMVLTGTSIKFCCYM